MATVHKTSRATFDSVDFTEILPRDVSREYLQIVNNSGEDLWLFMDVPTATPTEASSITLADGHGLELLKKPITSVRIKGKAGAGEVDIIVG